MKPIFDSFEYNNYLKKKRELENKELESQLLKFRKQNRILIFVTPNKEK